MSIARQVKETIETKCPGTFSLYAGYGLHGGKSVPFPQGVQQLDKRNEAGRCIQSRYQYADGSTLTYKFLVGSGGYVLSARDRK